MNSNEATSHNPSTHPHTPRTTRKAATSRPQASNPDFPDPHARAGTRRKPREDFKEVACPKCEAEVGVSCRRLTGKPPPYRSWSHKERIVRFRYGLMPDEAHAVALADLNRTLGELHAGLTCCSHSFADLGGFERHRLSGHGEPRDLGLIPGLTGWSSR